MKSNENIIIKSEELGFVNELKQIVQAARQQAYSAINFSQVCANWLLGQRIVVQEQAGQNRAEYGKRLIKLVAQELSKEFGAGYSVTNIKNYRRFYIEFQDTTKGQTVSDQFIVEEKGQTLPDQLKNNLQLKEFAIRQALPALLSWSHYERLMRVANRKARDWYMNEAATQMWSLVKNKEFNK
jgi:hypothetical protein